MTERNPKTQATLIVGALAILVSGWVHFYLYFRGGYRGIHPDEFAGITISRSFALNAIAAVVIAELLVLALKFDTLVLPAAAMGAGFGVATIVAYVLSRTNGLLGFKETATTTEAVIALIAEAVAVVALAPVALAALKALKARTSGRAHTGVGVATGECPRTLRRRTSPASQCRRCCRRRRSR